MSGFRFRPILISAVPAAAAAVLFARALSLPVVELFPSSVFAKAVPWDDRLEKEDSLSVGNSASELIALDNKIVWRWRVSPGFAYPYAGFEVQFRSGSSDWVDLSECDSVYVGLSSAAGGELLAELRTFDPARTVPNDPDTRRLLQKRVEFGPGQSAVALALSDFRMPDWWREEKKIPQTSNEPFLERTFSLGFQADERLLGRADTVEVLWISAADGNWRARAKCVLAGMILALVSIGLLFAEQFSRRRRRIALLPASRGRAAASPSSPAPSGSGTPADGNPAAPEVPSASESAELPPASGESVPAESVFSSAPAAEIPSAEPELPEEPGVPEEPESGPETAEPEEPEAPGPSWPEEDYARVEAWMSEHFTSADATPEAAAGDLGWSVSKLGRVVKAGRGKTFSAWVLDLRLQRAVKMLAETTLTVAQIAYDNGFAQPSHFNRRFNERYGTTPTEYRRSRR